MLLGELSLEKYSVLMAVYEKEKPIYLKESIESMLNQTVFPDQFVIVKDGMLTSELDAVINEFASRYEELFTIIELHENQGLANALNEGLKACRNELVARMDSDDFSKPKRCELILDEFIKDKDLAICGCNIEEFNVSTDNITGYRIVPTLYEDILKFGRRRQPFNHPTVIYKKSIIQACDGYIQLRRKEDW